MESGSELILKQIKTGFSPGAREAVAPVSAAILARLHNNTLKQHREEEAVMQMGAKLVSSPAECMHIVYH